MTLDQQILSILAQHEPLTANEIAQRCGENAFMVRRKLESMPDVLSHDDGVCVTYWLDDGNDAPGAA